MLYFDGYLLVASHYNFKFTSILPSEINNTIDKFQQQDDALAPLIEKESHNVISHDRIVTMIQYPYKREVVFIC